MELLLPLIKYGGAGAFVIAFLVMFERIIRASGLGDRLRSKTKEEEKLAGDLSEERWINNISAIESKGRETHLAITLPLLNRMAENQDSLIIVTKQQALMSERGIVAIERLEVALRESEQVHQRVLSGVQILIDRGTRANGAATGKV